MTEKMMNEKLLKIADFEQKYGKDHGITNVIAMKKYCSDKQYRERVHAFNKASAETIKYYKLFTC
jgi:hypothetical protein